MVDAVISAVLEQIAIILREHIQNGVSLVRGVENEIDNLSKELQNVRNKLEDAERKQFGDKSVRAWLVRLQDASYQMEDVLDEWHYVLKFQIQQQQSSCAPKNKVCSFISCSCFQKIAIRRDIANKIKNVKAKLDVILAEKDRYGLVTSSPPTTIHQPLQRQTISSVDLAKVSGRNHDRDVVASKIFVTASPDGQVGTEDERQLLDIVSIVGVGGIGKTTLAQLIFNDIRVKDCFDLPIWVYISDPFDVAEIVKHIVESVTGSSPISDQLEELVKRLQACILGKKFLLVLDDVWTEDHAKWELLKDSLKSCCPISSKILVTTRNEMVAKTLDTIEDGIYRLGGLSDESCWLLLKRIALFGKGEEECAKYEEIGMKIVGKCKGLPLAAKTLGSLLRFKNGLEEWEDVLNSEIWELEKAKDGIFPHFLLSYNELSPALKRCFSYCAVFPKGSEIQVEEVIGHWMALGYLGSDIESGGGGEMELRGRQYFENLAMHSLFQDFTKYDSGEGEKIMSFKLHDIVHDFAQFLRKNGTTAEVEAGANKCQACSPYESISQVKLYRSLFWDDNDSPILCSCLGSLRVLGLSGYIKNPNAIEKYIHLRWLDLSFNSALSLRETVCNELYNLQTLLLVRCKLKEIPMGIGNLVNLRHLDLSRNESLTELPSGIGNLIKLRHFGLSHNYSLLELPENICDMCEMETLDIDCCENLSKLPQGIHRLVNLKHLHNRNTPSLKQFPQGIAQLTCLRTLTEFRVEKDMGKLRWLKSLNRLGGSLKLIVNLTVGSGNTDVDDVREGELMNKECIKGLEIVFNDKSDEVEDCVRMDVVNALQPHPDLQELEIWFFQGSGLPRWIVSPLNKVEIIYLYEFDHLKSVLLLPLGKLPFLEVMEFHRMPQLRFVGCKLTTETSIVFPKLRRLTFQDCPKWDNWEDIDAQEEEDEKVVVVMPCLTGLKIRRCKSLAALPHRLLCKVASSLLYLDIRESTQLDQRYGDKENLPWKSISHTNPRIQLFH